MSSRSQSHPSQSGVLQDSPEYRDQALEIPYVRAGIDLGATNSSIAVMDASGPRLLAMADGSQVMPSVVWRQPGGSLLVGRPALEATLQSHQRDGGAPPQYKRRIAQDDCYEVGWQPTMTAPEIAASVIRELLGVYTRSFPGLQPKSCAIAVPCVFGQRECYGVRAAARQAGLLDFPLIAEPIAAVLACRRRVHETKDGELWLTFDLSGDALSLALVEIRSPEPQIVEHNWENTITGVSFDDTILSHVLSELRGRYGPATNDLAYDAARRSLRHAAENAKIVLSSASTTDLVVDGALCKDQKGRSIRLQITRDQYEQLIGPEVEKAVSVCQMALSSWRSRASPISRVVLIGGAAKIPYVQHALRARLNVPLIGDVDPMTVVAQGAAVYASTVEIPSEVLEECTQGARLSRNRRPPSEHHPPGPTEEAPSGDFESSEAISDSAVVCGDVTNLRLRATPTGVELRWNWPAECTSACVLWRKDDWPTSPSDEQAQRVVLSITEYGHAGGKWSISLPPPGGHFYYVVHTQSPSGCRARSVVTSRGCRADIQWAPATTIDYRLSSVASHGSTASKILLAWSIKHARSDFAGFALMANRERVPKDALDGVELYRSVPEDHALGSHQKPIGLDAVQSRGLTEFYAKVVVLDPAQRGSTLIVHPNTCAPILSTGEVPGRDTSKPPHVYRAGTPDEVVCPHCFERFSLEKMLFASFADKDDVRHGHYTWWHRLRRLPPEPPRNKRLKRMKCKLCPDGHVLPFSAGAQHNLMIGLVGAKVSSKTTYVTALVHRLYEQVASDLGATLLPASDETSKRFRQLDGPLFEQRLELPFTVGTPPPLIYDLQVNAGLRGKQRRLGRYRHRAVTLSLHDTSGENLESKDSVEQMMKYLRVASGIILLVDPLQVPEVRDKLAALGGFSLPTLDPEAEPLAILSRVLLVLEDWEVWSRSQPVATPVAVLLTKCDVLRDAGLMDRDAGFIDLNRLWCTNTRHISHFDWQIHDDMVGMMGEFVQRWHPALFNEVRQRFLRSAFFGASATGCASDSRTHRYPFVAPWRVEDPLLWLLAELEVVPASGIGGM